MAKYRVAGVTPVDPKLVNFGADIGMEAMRNKYKAIAPVILPHIQRWYSAHMGNDIISILNVQQGASVLKPNFDGKDIKVLGSQKVVWRGQRPGNKIYNIVRDTRPDSDGSIGRNKKPFYIYLDRDPGVKVTLGCAIGSHIELLVQGTPEETLPGVWRTKVQLLGDDDTRFVPREFLKKGRPIFRSGLYAGERSYEGPGIEGSFGEWFEGYSMAGRMEIGMSGDAYYSQFDNRVFQVKFHDMDGNDVSDSIADEDKFVLVDKLDIAAIQNLNRLMRHQLVWGQTSMRDNGSWIRDEGNNMEIIRGNGIYYQMDRSTRRVQGDWVGKGGWRKIDNILKNFDRLSGGDDNVIYGLFGRERRNQLRYMFTELFNMQPADTFLVKEAGKMGVKINFDTYEIDGIKLVMAKDNFGDNPYLPYVRDSRGIAYDDYRACFLNLTPMKGKGGKKYSPIQLFTLGNSKGDRRFAKGTIPSLANIGKNGMIATAVDETSTHYYSQLGAVCLDPYSGMVEVTKAIDYKTATW